MKKFIVEFIKRGLMAASGGPIILAIIYFILEKTHVVSEIPASEVSLGIITLSILAFVLAGISAIYQVEKLSVFTMALIHGIVIYALYVTIYLINGWLAAQIVPFLIFTGIFIAGYALVWAIVYISIRISTKKLNSKLKNKTE